MLGSSGAFGKRSRFGSFTRKQKRFLEKDFDQAVSMSFDHRTEGKRPPEGEWVIRGELSRFFGTISLACVPSYLGTPATVLLQQFESVLELVQPPYGYRFCMRRSLCPECYVTGTPEYHAGKTRTQDYTRNVQGWGDVLFRRHGFDCGLLRDVYPVSYLSAAYLNAPMGKSRDSLRRWIEADPSRRGELRPCTSTLMRWEPPIQEIPTLREELFRAGRIFYWKFLTPRDPYVAQSRIPHELYRPILADPWQAPDPIPEIYRADFWKDKDPGLTY